MRAKLLVVALLGATTYLIQPAVDASHAVPVPTLSAPPAGLRGHPLFDSWFDLAPYGYEEQEYLVSGTARSASGATAPYTTRIIVTRPVDDADFNGTVLLDWVNVTAQFENAVDTMHARPMLLREGYAFVHVSAQAAGLCCTPLTPRVWDPVRYAGIAHPGDAYAEDIFTQVARAFEATPAALGLPAVERILAAGQSQSANRLVGYIQTWLPNHPEAAGIIDGFLVHGNVPGTKAFATAAAVPVLQLLSDYEAVNDGVDPSAVNPDHYRLWEVAASAHADYWIGYQSMAGHGPRVVGGAPKTSRARQEQLEDEAGNYGEVPHPLLAVCTAAGASMPMHYVASAAIHHLNTWARGGAAPPNGPRFEFGPGGQRATDELGNTRGGIRLPPVDVPVARYQTTTCQLGGITIPLTEVELLGRYGSHADYYQAFAARTADAQAAGWLLPEDAADLLRRACRASNRFPGTPAADC